MRRLYLLLACWTALSATASLQDRFLVTGSIAVTGAQDESDRDNVAVWLVPIGESRDDAAEEPAPRLRMLQKHKHFTPHLLMARVGSVVEFPNADPFFHNVFSMHDGKRFDLGLYEGGTSRRVRFTRPGICYVFCNIHPEMSALIVVVDTKYMAVSTRTGDFTIPDVPAGRYMLSAWHERYGPPTADAFPREVTISDGNPTLGVIRLVDDGKAIAPHKNKYGRDYNPPSQGVPTYK